MVTTRSSASNGKKTVNYNESDEDKKFNRRLKMYNDKKQDPSTPDPSTPTTSNNNHRKRKQNEMSVASESDYNPTDEYLPPSKKRKTHHHIDTPHPQRRSTRIACKQSLSHDQENELNGHNEYEVMENEEKDTSQRHSIINTIQSVQPRRKSARLQSKTLKIESINNSNNNNAFHEESDSSIDMPTKRRMDDIMDDTINNGAVHDGMNGHDVNKNNHSDNDGNWANRLRRSARNNRYISTKSNLRTNPDIIDDEDGMRKKKRIDSDYGDAEFEQDCQEEEEIDEDAAETEAESEGDTSGNDGRRRRSQRLLEKSTIHYYNDGTDITIENDKKQEQEEQDADKSNSLPLSLRRPKRTRKPVVNIYEVAQYESIRNRNKNRGDRRASLRSKKPVNYAESPANTDNDDEEDTDSDDVGTTISSTRSPSRRSSSSYGGGRRGGRRRKRKRIKRRGRGGRGTNKRRRRRSISYESTSDDDVSSSDSYSTDTLMDIREQKRIARERKKIKPIQIHDLGLYHEGMAPNLSNKHKKDKKEAADISPMDIDCNIDWNMVGGLQHHVQKLKEMVILPLLYPSEFEQFKMSTPKGVLFHGPPGTGKTLVARILAAQCSIGNNPDGTPCKKVAFYMRKGADCLSKWVGEAERQLRLLFDEAHKNQPAVIFFDEIDGLAPVRSSRQDQIHSSIVSTLLALMDGLDSRGQIIVIGATNRPDAIDPALRRPGRFDRELCFNLPSKKARKEILKIHTKSWDDTNCKLNDELLNYLSEQSVGYCGADLEALCREAFLAAVRRTYPQIYHSNIRLQIDTKKLQVIREDFEKALKDITPSSQRSSLVYARALPDLLRPLLERQLDAIRHDIESIFSLKKEEYEDDEIAVIEENNNNNNNNNNRDNKKLCCQHYRYLIHGCSVEYGQSYLGTAVLHLMEEYPMYSLDLASLYGDSSTKCADEAILRIFKEAQRNTPSVIYWPHIDRWWNAAHDILKTSIALLINDISHDCPILIVATSNISMEDLDDGLFKLFEKYSFHDCNQQISDQQRKEYWHQIKIYMKEKPKNKPKTIEEYPNLPIAELPKSKKNEIEKQKQLTQTTESETLIEQEKMSCVNLRVYIRSVCNRLCKHFKNFIDQMDEDGVVKNNLSLFEIRQRNNERAIPTVIAFLKDIDRLVQNVKESAQTESLKARQFINEACHLQDQALSMMSQVNRDLVKQCDKMAAKQQQQQQQQQQNVNNNNNNNNTKTIQRKVSFADDIDMEDTSNNTPIIRRSSLRNNKKSDKSEKDDDDEDEDDDMDIDNKEEDNNHNHNNNNNNNNDDDEHHEVEINDNRIAAIITKLVSLTEGYVIEEMEEKMYNLLRIIYQYSNKWDRNPMIDELNDHIQTYFKKKQQNQNI